MADGVNNDDSRNQAYLYILVQGIILGNYCFLSATVLITNYQNKIKLQFEHICSPASMDIHILYCE